jgi:hypothetical protein
MKILRITLQAWLQVISDQICPKVLQFYDAELNNALKYSVLVLRNFFIYLYLTEGSSKERHTRKIGIFCNYS